MSKYRWGSWTKSLCMSNQPRLELSCWMLNGTVCDPWRENEAKPIGAEMSEWGVFEPDLQDLEIRWSVLKIVRRFARDVYTRRTCFGEIHSLIITLLKWSSRPHGKNFFQTQFKIVSVGIALKCHIDFPTSPPTLGSSPTYFSPILYLVVLIFLLLRSSVVILSKQYWNPTARLLCY